MLAVYLLMGDAVYNGVMIIVVWHENGDTSSNPGRG